MQPFLLPSSSEIPLNKVTTKLNNYVRKALANAKPQAIKNVDFDYFSYTVDWSNFPNSLMIHCHMKQDFFNQTDIEENPTLAEFSKIVQLNLLKQGIKFKDFRNNITLSASDN